MKHLGALSAAAVTLVSDNSLHYEPRRYDRTKVQLRGHVLRVLRTPDRRGVGNLTEQEQGLLEFYQSPPGAGGPRPHVAAGAHSPRGSDGPTAALGATEAVRQMACVLPRGLHDSPRWSKQHCPGGHPSDAAGKRLPVHSFGVGVRGWRQADG